MEELKTPPLPGWDKHGEYLWLHGQDTAKILAFAKTLLGDPFLLSHSGDYKTGDETQGTIFYGANTFCYNTHPNELFAGDLRRDYLIKPDGKNVLKLPAHCPRVGISCQPPTEEVWEWLKSQGAKIKVMHKECKPRGD